MSRVSQNYRLTFVLPKAARQLASGHFTGWVKDCELDIAGPFVAVLAPSKERAMEQAAKVVRITCHDLAHLTIAARLDSPDRCAGSDAWTIIVNADIAFAPTGLGAEFPEKYDGAAAHLV